ncbi:hypothetical protein LguiB_026425 [Lonicera macranthoides]
MTSPVKPVNRSVVRYKLFPPILPLLLMMTSSFINSGSSVSLSTICKNQKLLYSVLKFQFLSQGFCE